MLGNARILDLCSGQGRHSIFLAKKFPHLDIYAHDQSSYLISLARQRAQSQHVDVTFTVGDCRSIPYPQDTFDFIMVMGNSFGYFANDDGDRVVLNEMFRVLKPGGHIIIDLTDGEYMKNSYTPRSWEWIDDRTFACRERSMSKDGLRLVSREVITDVNTGVLRDQFYQERLYTRQELHSLLTTTGFHISVHGKTGNEVKQITAAKELSKRNEDLGMMEQRMLIKATKMLDLPPLPVSSTATLVSTSKYPFQDLYVLLGDPSQPCFGKLNNTWNKEDLETRSILIKSLLDIGFPADRIHILSSHQDYASVLSKDTPFVLNLCDEGFNNDALKELHVPALLEMLSIPYTGANPNSLAICYDKGLVNQTAASIGVHVPKEIYVFLEEESSLVKVVEKIEKRVGFPAFLKPLKGDNSLGITVRSIVKDKKEAEAYLKELEALQLKDIIVQEYLQGTEYGVGMIGNPENKVHFFPILEVDYEKIVEQGYPPILGYESKWDPSSPYWTDIKYKRATLSPAVESYLKEACIKLWKRFGCRDYARFDFRCDVGKGDGSDQGVIKLLEVNPNPGWCWDGKLTYMAKMEGWEYKDVVQKIMDAGVERLFPANGSIAASAE